MATPGNEQEKQAQREALAAWLQDRWRGEHSCSICQTNRWSIGDIGELRTFQGGGLVVGGPVYPVFPVTCDNCGNTMLINAVLAGIIEPGGSEPDQTPEATTPANTSTAEADQ